jgi:predicted phosphodiesterase
MAEQLHGMFFPSGEIEDVAHAFIDVLRYGDSSCAEGKHQQFSDLDAFATCFDEDEPMAILADVHANLPALQAVLTEVRHRGIERIFVLGDLVGYGPHPKECIDLLREVGAISLRGNHDHAVGTGDMVLSMTSSSTWTAKWTLERLGDDDCDYLRHLPLRMTHRPWLAVHGAPVDKTFFNAYVYNRTAEANVRWVKEQGYRFALHGHSHLQGVYAEQGDDVICVKDAKIDLEQYQTSLICPGSVGQPRGGEVGAAFAVLRPLSAQLELLCLPYQVNEIIQDMIIEGFPEQLMKRLKTGV